MFQNWGFLLTEIWLLLALAALVGLLAGWILWGRAAGVAEADGAGGAGADAAGLEAAEAAMARLRAERDEAVTRLDRCRSDGEKKDARMKEVEMELDELRGKAAFTAPLPAFEAESNELRGYDETSGSPAEPAEVPGDYQGDHDGEGAGEGTAPERLEAPREGGPDDLKKIRGVGRKLEAMLHGMGFYHYDQIAGWTEAEVAWVNANLTGFRGRVTRDNWVEQARLLAGGGETEFSRKVDGGDVYD